MGIVTSGKYDITGKETALGRTILGQSRFEVRTSLRGRLGSGVHGSQGLTALPLHLKLDLG